MTEISTLRKLTAILRVAGRGAARITGDRAKAIRVRKRVKSSMNRESMRGKRGIGKRIFVI
jgi:hypothetical protein